MPDSSLMLELCNILGITVNELLSGERIEMKDYMEKSEANIISVMSEEKKRRKRLYVIIDGLLFVFCIVVFLYTRFFLCLMCCDRRVYYLSRFAQIY